MLKESGKQEKFPTGAVRDTNEGKSAMELIPWEILPDKIFTNITKKSSITETDKEALLTEILDLVMRLRITSFSEMWMLDNLIVNCFDLVGKNYLDTLYDLGIHYGEGATKYGANNFMLGQKLSHITGSFLRHLTKYMQGWKDEDPHERGMLWNVINMKFVLTYYKENEEICDMKHWYKDERPNIKGEK